MNNEVKLDIVDPTSKSIGKDRKFIQMVELTKELVQLDCFTENNPKTWLTDSDYLESISEEIAGKIEKLATMYDEFLINEQGNGFATIPCEVMKSNGFHPMVGERDSFGIVTAYIQTPIGRILFG